MADLSFPRRRESIELADDGGRERTIDHLREGVVGEVGIAAIHAVRQPFFLEAAGGVVQIVGLVALGVADSVEQAAGAVASIQVPPLEVMVKRSPSPLNFCLEAHCGNARWPDRQYPCGFQGIHLCKDRKSVV